MIALKRSVFRAALVVVIAFLLADLALSPLEVFSLTVDWHRPKAAKGHSSGLPKSKIFPENQIPKIKSIFAKSWIDQAQPGWWIQNGQGARKKK